MRGLRYRSAIEPPYRWRDWAANAAGITGPELITFVQQDEAMRPDGTRGPGLFAYLRGLQGGNGAARRREVIATVFAGVQNRMTSGYLLRDVLNKVGGIHFTSQDEIFTLGHLYETMLREMRDAAGQNGEFYTPRPVVRFMVEMIDPKIGETVLDPACGTGGFLAEAYQHLEKQCQTVGERFILQNDTLLGGEAKPFPYLLCQMNLLLHGLEAPEIDPGNSLRFQALRAWRQGPRRRDPHQSALRRRGGGGHQRQFPGRHADLGDRTPVPSAHHAQAQAPWARIEARPGRHGRAQRHALRRRRLRPDQGAAAQGLQPAHHRPPAEWRLRAIHPNPDQSPVLRPIQSERRRSGTTRVPAPEGRKNYSKTKPMQYEEFTDCIAWWKQREENEHAWCVRADDVLKYDTDGRLLSANLDLKNPNSAETLEHLPPEQLVEDILAKERRIIEIMHEIKAELSGAKEAAA